MRKQTKKTNEINSADIEWFGGAIENESGRLQYSAVHAWVGDETLCGATPRGEITDVSTGDECKNCLKKVAKIERAEAEQVEPKKVEPVVDIDELIAHNSGFSSLDDMLNARGGYRPSCDVSRLEMELIADAYDAAQTARGDERRAFRY